MRLLSCIRRNKRAPQPPLFGTYVESSKLPPDSPWFRYERAVQRALDEGRAAHRANPDTTECLVGVLVPDTYYDYKCPGCDKPLAAPDAGGEL